MKETACNTSEVVCYSIVFGALDDNMIGGDRGISNNPAKGFQSNL